MEMTSFATIKTTKMFWHQCQNTIVRFERENDITTLVLGEKEA